MTVLLNGSTGKPVNVPEELVERFKAAGFKEPAAPAPERSEKPAPRTRRKSD